MSGSIIGGMTVKDAILLAYDTRVHQKKAMKKEYSWVEKKRVEIINQKVHLAQYCALAACGTRSFSVDIHGELLKKVTRLLSLGSKEQLTGDQAAKFLEKIIQRKVEAVGQDKEKKSKVLDMVRNCSLILGLWEKTTDDRMVPKLKRLYNGQILEDAKFCAFGVQHQEAINVMTEKYIENMSVKQGVDLMVAAFKAAFEKDKEIILGGHIEVLVLGCRDINVLPLSRGEQRAITFLRIEQFRDRGVRPIPKQEEIPKKGRKSTQKQERTKKRRLILEGDSDEEKM